MASVGGSMGRLFAALTLGAATFVVLLTIRVVLESKASYESAQEHLEQDDTAAALDDLESAVKAYAPGNPYSKAAAEKISIIAKTLRMRGDRPTSLQTWEVLRRSILATRHFVQPHSNLLEDAEASIEAMTSQSSKPAGTNLSNRSRTTRPTDPSALLSLGVFAGLIFWVSGAILVLASPKKEKRKATSLGWLISLAGLATWLLSSWIA